MSVGKQPSGRLIRVWFEKRVLFPKLIRSWFEGDWEETRRFLTGSFFQPVRQCWWKQKWSVSTPQSAESLKKWRFKVFPISQKQNILLNENPHYQREKASFLYKNSVPPYGWFWAKNWDSCSIPLEQEFHADDIWVSSLWNFCIVTTFLGNNKYRKLEGLETFSFKVVNQFFKRCEFLESSRCFYGLNCFTIIWKKIIYPILFIKKQL